MIFSKIIIYGHKLNSHTQSYINYGFYKAFNKLGFDTYWLDDQDDLSNINFDNSLFLTEAQAENKIPINNSSKYIDHTTGINYITRNGEHKISTGIPLLVNHAFTPNLTVDLFNYESINTAEKINDYTYRNGNILIQPWATDLLPIEFDYDKALLPRKPEAYFFGTVVELGWNNNFKEISEFEKSCKEFGISFDYRGLYTKGPVSAETIFEKMSFALAAPIIQSEDQIDSGYLTDRLFKNISYGHYCLTNSNVIGKVLPEIESVICESPKNMLNKLFELQKRDSYKSILVNQMKYIADNHTYINRVKTILEHI